MNVRELVERLGKEDPEAVVIFTFAESDLNQMAEELCVEVTSIETGDGCDGSEVWIGA